MSRRQSAHPNLFARIWSKAFASGRRKAPSTARLLVRPRLECLEDRLVPAVIDVTTLAPTGAGSLSAAFQTANTNGQTNNTIDITVAGTYNIGQVAALQVFANATNGQSGLSLTIQNTRGGTAAINGDNMTRVFDINPYDINGGATPNGTILGAVTINGISIENGLAQPGDTQVGSGGGVRDQGPVDLTLNNDIITNCSATADGGGINQNVALPVPTLSLVDDTITGNFASEGGGLFDDAASGQTIQNTILAKNLASTTGPDFDAPNNPTGVDLGGNLIGIGNPTIFNSGTTQQGASTNPLNPLLGPLTNNGGPVAGAAGAQMTVETEAELPGSPAIGKGVNNNIAQDERGFPRTNTFDVGAFQFQNVTLQLNIGTQGTLGLGNTETVTVTVTNTSNNPLPTDNSILTVNATGGLNIGGTQTFTLGPIGPHQSQMFAFNAGGAALGTQIITASVTSPDANPNSVSTHVTVNVVPTTMTTTTTTPVGGLTLFAFGLGPTGIDLFEIDSIGDIFAVPFMGGGGPIFVNTALHLPLALIQDGQLLALLAGIQNQQFVIDIINPFVPTVEAAVLAALHL